MQKLKLIIPTQEYGEQVMNYRQAFLERNEKLSGCVCLEDVNTYDEWLNFKERGKKAYKHGYVPESVFLAIREEDNKLIGIINIRHKLNDFLQNYGGHIGYSILPSERRKGYAKEMLKLALEKCKELKMDKVLITCDKDNVGSYKTILANGGILENEVEDNSRLGKSRIMQRYWINLS